MGVFESKQAEGGKVGEEKLIQSAEDFANEIGAKCLRDLTAEATKTKADMKKSMDVVGQEVL